MPHCVLLRCVNDRTSDRAKRRQRAGVFLAEEEAREL